jgi:DNA-directed RNA polymerase I, II, and III subunit RPABC4
MQSPTSPYESPMAHSSPVMSPTVQPHSPQSPTTPYTPGATVPSQGVSTQQGNTAVTTYITYLCGYCGRECPLKPKDVIRCRSCGHRVMFKKRTNRSMWYTYCDYDVNSHL